MTENMIIDPFMDRYTATGMPEIDRFGAYFRKQVDEQGVFPECHKKRRPTRFLPELYKIEQDGQEDAIQSQRIDHKGACPYFLIDRKDQIPEITCRQQTESG